MSAGGVTVEGGAGPRASGPAPDQRVFAAYRTELLKLSSQLAVRLLVLVCAIGPVRVRSAAQGAERDPV